MLMLALYTASTAASWAEFATRQIADESLANREAVIGGNGLVYWIAHSTNDTSASITDLIRYNNGDRISMCADYLTTFNGSDKPMAQGSNIVWIANYRRFENPSWVMAEVPEDPNSPPEIPATYAPFEDAVGHQWFVNLADSTNGIIIYTNQGVVVTNVIGNGSGTNQNRRGPSGVVEINLWQTGTGEVIRVTTDSRNDFAPTVWDGLVSWQKARGWPFGWEIMMWETGKTWQITTNFFYDMAPMVQGRQMVWYGWDGFDFEIFLYDADTHETIQITSNRYDDVSPVLWDGVVAWEGYPAVEADIFMWKNGQITKLSDNVEDDFNPRIWNGQVVWQSFDGDDFEIYLFDGSKTIKLTANNYDDVNPEIRDGLITWMGYEGNWDAEIYAWDGKKETRLTDNDAEDRDPKTADGRIVWTVVTEGRSQVWLAEPE